MPKNITPKDTRACEISGCKDDWECKVILRGDKEWMLYCFDHAINDLAFRKINTL